MRKNKILYEIKIIKTGKNEITMKIKIIVKEVKITKIRMNMSIVR